MPSKFALAIKLDVLVENSLELNRPSEVITLSWSEIQRYIPNANIHKLIVKNSSGLSIAYQVIKSDYSDKGISKDFTFLLFQHNFKENEKEAKFTIEQVDFVVKPFENKTCARIVPERLDDFAWENDKIAHRTYGPALEAPDSLKIGKEVLRASGIDVWSKRVSYCIIDRWYNRGNYHQDDGEGMDMYKTGETRGTGGTGIWDGKVLRTSGNFKSWRIFANGPIRTVFELSYDAWDANGTKVTEIKRFTVDAGHYLDTVESRFVFSDNSTRTVGLGISKSGAEHGQFTYAPTLNRLGDINALSQWQHHQTNGDTFHAVILNKPIKAFGEDTGNQLIFTNVASGEVLKYWAGAAWSEGGEITSNEQWLNYLQNEVKRNSSPLIIKITPLKP